MQIPPFRYSFPNSKGLICEITRNITPWSSFHEWVLLVLTSEIKPLALALNVKKAWETKSDKVYTCKICLFVNGTNPILQLAKFSSYFLFTVYSDLSNHEHILKGKHVFSLKRTIA